MSRVQQAVLSETFNAGPFQGSSSLNVERQKSPQFFYFIVFHICFSQTHKTLTVKEELLSPASTCIPVSFKSSEGGGDLEKGKKRKAKAERIKAPAGWKCQSCNLQFTEKEDYVNHMSQQHGKVSNEQTA